MTRLLHTARRCLAIFLLMVSTGFSELAFAELFAAVLPSSRSVQVNQYATFFASVINAGTEDLSNCRAQIANGVPGTFWYRPTDRSNFPVGERSTSANIPAGSAQSYFLEFRSSSILVPVELSFNFLCDGTDPAPITPGVNTALFSASATQPPDIIAVTATLTRDGIVNLPIDGSGAFFAAATTNVGATADLTVRAIGTGDAALTQLTVCETIPSNGQCRSLATTTQNVRIPTRTRDTFTVFMRSTQNIPFDPARNRVALQFVDSTGEVRGSTSIAVRSADLTISGVPPSSLLAGQSYTFTPVVGQRSNRTLKFSLDNQPSWLSVSEAGVLTGTPSEQDVGLYKGLVLSVSDGTNTKSLPPFNIEVIASQWRSGPTLPYETARHTMATLGAQMFYFGTRPQSLGIEQNGTREYDASINSWTARTPMPNAVTSGNSHGINDQVYVFGGVNNLVQRYDPLADSWLQVGSSPDRYGAASVVVDGLVYLIGGVRRNVTGSNLSSQLDIYNPADNSSIIGPPAPIRCDGSGAAAIDDIIYLTGGCALSSQVHAFDTNTGTWSQTTSMPVALAYHQSIAVNGKLYVMGGYRTDSAGVRAARAQTYVFDPSTTQWETLQPMDTPRAEFGAALFNGEIWVTGGFDGNQRRTDKVEILTPDP